MAKKNYTGWSGSDYGVYDAAGRKITGPEAEAFLEWKRATKAGPGDVVGESKRFRSKKDIEAAQKAKANKETNRFRIKRQKALKPSTRVWNVPRKYEKYFHYSAFNRDKAGRSPLWSKNLTLQGGKSPNYNWERVKYVNFRGASQHTRVNELWGSNIDRGGVGILNGGQGLIRQLQIAQAQVMINAEHFRVLVGERAIQVFRNSFKYHKFYSAHSTPWHPLADFTIRKREKRGTGSRILVEYRDLMDSFKLEKNAEPITTRVSTDIVQPNEAHHKRYAICYAGWHNEGEGTYGNGFGGRSPKQYIKRQFMGHSTYLNPVVDPFLKKMMKTYLFDAVFKVPKT